MISKNKHNLKVGDIVYIEQDPGFTNASYNGEHIIQDIISDFIVITDQAWALNTGAEGGSGNFKKIYLGNNREHPHESNRLCCVIWIITG